MHIGYSSDDEKSSREDENVGSRVNGWENFKRPVLEEIEPDMESNLTVTSDPFDDLESMILQEKIKRNKGAPTKLNSGKEWAEKI